MLCLFGGIEEDVEETHNNYRNTRADFQTHLNDCVNDSVLSKRFVEMNLCLREMNRSVGLCARSGF